MTEENKQRNLMKPIKKGPEPSPPVIKNGIAIEPDTDRDVDAMRTAIGGLCPQIFGKDTKLHSLLTDITAKSDHEEMVFKIETSDEGLITVAKAQGEDAQPSNQRDNLYTSMLAKTIVPPVDVIVARSLKDISPHHASCINSILNAMIGLGFVSAGDEVEQKKDDTGTSIAGAEEQIVSLLTGEAFISSKVDEILDPLTIDGFSLELSRAVEDFLDAGTGYLEIIRDDRDIISGINWIPYEDLMAATIRDKNGKNWVFYGYRSSFSGSDTSGDGSIFGRSRKYSMFGINNRNFVYDTFYKDSKDIKKQNVSEVIAFKAPSNKSKYYGYPGWLSAASLITLLALSMQYKSDFYTNRGVLAYILSVTGPMATPIWNSIQAAVQGSVGGGNNFRNMAIQSSNTDTKVQVDKLATTDKTELQFAKDTEVYAQNIVSAHRVPPVLANILIPGKLGASNEAVQALVSFQLLNVGPKQNIVQQTLGRTLGSAEGVPELKPEDFRLRKITSQFNIAGLDTVGRMREEAIDATEEDGSQRDVSGGVKD